jgi:hypothetical protein
MLNSQFIGPKDGNMDKKLAETALARQ